jgi:hypothetical protein
MPRLVLLFAIILLTFLVMGGLLVCIRAWMARRDRLLEGMKPGEAGQAEGRGPRAGGHTHESAAA